MNVIITKVEHVISNVNERILTQDQTFLACDTLNLKHLSPLDMTVIKCLYKGIKLLRNQEIVE